MTKNEIKKDLYKSKNVAIMTHALAEGCRYVTRLTNGDKVSFFIPIDEMTEGFNNQEPAQLLIRWLEK